MKNREQEMRETYAVFVQAWKFYKDYWDVERKDEYWEAVIAEADRLYRENKSPLLRALLGEVIQDMQRRMKESLSTLSELSTKDLNRAKVDSGGQ